ncbi:hypothetical protein DY000_02008903 [Brassica cretica]|uniref:PRONE domain-containing protein n=1 Tax=Brassica cretica TaxID=69181 RepID=A0ABQ7CDV2_BRACR|nr:hypothetical protein DY000_02008903 [Brassica cretica]
MPHGIPCHKFRASEADTWPIWEDRYFLLNHWDLRKPIDPEWQPFPNRPGMATFSHLLAALKAGRCNTTAKVRYLYRHAPPITCDQKTYLLKHSMRSSHMQRGGTATIKGRDNAPPPFKCDCSVFGRPGTSEAVLNSWSGYAHREHYGVYPEEFIDKEVYMDLDDVEVSSLYLSSHNECRWRERESTNHIVTLRSRPMLTLGEQRLCSIVIVSNIVRYMQDFVNKDVIKAMLESCSRVLQGLAFNTVAWNDSVIFVDKSMR